MDGFYDTLLTFFDRQLEEEFFDNSARSIVVSATTASELLDKLEVNNQYSSLQSLISRDQFISYQYSFSGFEVIMNYTLLIIII